MRNKRIFILWFVTLDTLLKFRYRSSMRMKIGVSFQINQSDPHSFRDTSFHWYIQIAWQRRLIEIVDFVGIASIDQSYQSFK